MAVVLLGLMAAPWSSVDVHAEPVPITEFAGGEANVTLTFAEKASNATAGIEVPRGATITSAWMDIEGVGGYQQDVRTLDLNRWDTGSPHRAWEGSIPGNYPPTSPYWDPYSPKGANLTRFQYATLGTSDGNNLETMTGTSSTGRYPFHWFKFNIPDGTLTALSIRWEGFGQCLASATIGGAEMFVWNNDTQAWIRADFYSQAGALVERVLQKSWKGPHDNFVDQDRNVFIIVIGKPSERSAGPNPVLMDGEIHTDYINVNATLEGQWTEAEDVNLTVAPTGELWNVNGEFTGRVRLGSGPGLMNALQAAVDDEEVLPSNITVPLVFSFENVTSAGIRLSNLSVVYEPVVNRAPTWTDLPVLSMIEDVDAEGLVDLEDLTEDDWSNGSLAFTVISASTTAIEAVVEEDHNLSFYVREADWFGRATFLINATDPWGMNTTSPTLVLDVIGVNDAPRGPSPGRINGTQGVPFYLRVEAVDVDGDPFTFDLDTEVFDINPMTGVIDFTPTNEQVGLHKVTVSVTDDQGGEALLWLELTIENVNDPPFIEDPGTIHGRQGEYLSYTFIVEDPDIIHGERLDWTLQGDTRLTEILEFSPILGVLVWRAPGNGDVGEHQLTITVEDTGGEEDIQQFLIVIANVNDQPTIDHVMDMTTFEDTLLTDTIHASDPDLDVDPEEELTWVVDPLLFQVAQDGSFTYVALHEHVGVHRMTVTVTDAYGASHSVAFFLTVISINHPPVIQAISDQEVFEDQEWTINIIVTDADVGDTVQVGARGAPFHVPTTGGLIIWTPQERHGGEHLVTLTATDNRGESSVLSFNLVVVTRNDPPTVEIKTPSDDAVVPGDGEVFLSSIGLDEEGDHMTFVWWWRYDDSPSSQWEKITTGPTGHWVDPPSGRLLIKVEVTDGEGTGTDQVVILVETAPDDGAGPTYLLAGVVALAVVLVLLFLMARKGLLVGRPEEPEPEAEAEQWEAVDDVEAKPPLHR
jgi:hypothetical protein